MHCALFGDRSTIEENHDISIIDEPADIAVWVPLQKDPHPVWSPTWIIFPLSRVISSFGNKCQNHVWFTTISCFRLNNLGETFLLWNQALGLFAATVWNWTPTDTGEDACQPADKANSGPASLQLSSALASLWEKFAVLGIIGRRMLYNFSFYISIPPILKNTHPSFR